MNLKKYVFATDGNAAGLLARLVLGIVLFPHGAQKMLGWFGGYGFSGTMGFFTGMMHLPRIIGLLVILVEFLGSLFLILGFAGRLTAALVAIDMAGIIFSAHIQNGFFMNWFGKQAGEGYEYHLLAIGLALVVLVSGSGLFSIDRKIK